MTRLRSYAVSLIVEPDCHIDEDEIDKNGVVREGVANGRMIELGKQYNATLCTETDVDYYRLPLAAGTYVRLAVQTPDIVPKIAGLCFKFFEILN